MIEAYKGDVDLSNFHDLLSELSNIWDDLIDKDKPVSDEQINKAFKIALIYLPSNPVYKQLGEKMPVFFDLVISAFEVANLFESAGVDRYLQISYGLRNAAGHILVAAIKERFNDADSKEIITKLWAHIFTESVDDYKKEHLI